MLLKSGLKKTGTYSLGDENIFVGQKESLAQIRRGKINTFNEERIRTKKFPLDTADPYPAIPSVPQTVLLTNTMKTSLDLQRTFKRRQKVTIALLCCTTLRSNKMSENTSLLGNTSRCRT